MTRLLLAILLFASPAWVYASAESDCPTTGPTWTIEGFGKNTTGGCKVGQNIYTVTSVADSGAGTLRNALTLTRPALIKFGVSGTITLITDLGISGNDVTIDGQDSPNGGIAIKGAPTAITSGGNIIIRHVRFRLGPNPPIPSSGDAIRIGGNQTVSNVVLDHVSVSWATDENISITTGASNVTVQHSISSYGLKCATHPECPHSMGFFIDVDAANISGHHNLLAHNNERVPAYSIFSAGTYTFEWVNNVIYNPGGISVAEFGRTDAANPTLQIESIGNYYKAGPNTTQTQPGTNYPSHTGYGTPAPKFYISGNIDWVRTDDSMAQNLIFNAVLSNHEIVANRFIAPIQITSTSAATAYTSVLANAGARLPCQDSIDALAVSTTTNGTGSHINDPSEIGGWPDLTQACGGGATQRFKSAGKITAGGKVAVQ